ncbi:nucleoside triphosphate pyrophosphohydrolase [Hyphobacterium marinum]|uniref:Nucleoside triphosphate pyrophosphohydrolase n=1 Tax=Hyphobacterium marinum TaxID=3116574 RepID=A0ABU7LYF7_9PROT|nr:nucleoside triphosphate pyrophosphohydrolase [Hyphobacterium sp. Y6023]MEE2566593.1 nucleoside triphosphate pyrophosphohydrolase [Hyphobacterium sp. Y6023]
MTAPDHTDPLQRLLAIMARLRDPETGCPWDVEQTFETISPYTIEEAYEVDDAIRRGDTDAIRDELGDLLLQVVFQSRIAEEAGLFNFDEVAAAIADKMVRRHPHVFGDAQERDIDTQSASWEVQKAAERREKDIHGLLDDIPLALPALKRAQKLQKRAGNVGFDWPDPERVLAKVEEELEEVREAMAAGNAADIQEEIGDLLFVCVNLSRKLKVNAEEATRDANAKFERRFRHIEARLKAVGKDMAATPLDELETLWDEAKVIDKAGKP